jgi:hypothetical protein
MGGGAAAGAAGAKASQSTASSWSQRKMMPLDEAYRVLNIEPPTAIQLKTNQFQFQQVHVAYVVVQFLLL